MSAIDPLTGAITIGVDPNIDLGPLTLTWHGVMIAVGVFAGGWLATVYARERGLERDRVIDLIVIMAVSGIVGARVFWLAERGYLTSPSEWFGAHGFSFYGAIILGVGATGAYMWRRGIGFRYLDALAAGFPLGTAVGRIGDVINGEHYGPASDLPWAVRNTHPDADVPSSVLAYHSGGLYEVVLGLVMLAIIWPLRHRFRRPGMLLWAVIGLYAAGRFVMFFYRSDSDDVALGLNGAQWTSLALIAAAALAAWLTLRYGERRGAAPERTGARAT
jgi:phosphatidylglycerol---prolipoprotein diacylglyceryl transferase